MPAADKVANGGRSWDYESRTISWYFALSHVIGMRLARDLIIRDGALLFSDPGPPHCHALALISAIL